MNELFKKLTSWIEYRNIKVRICIFCFPLLLVLIFLIIKIGWKNTYENIIQEDSTIEYMQSVFFGSASILTFSTFLAALKKGSKYYVFLFLFLSFGLLFICLEEISWGQRILKLNTPPFFYKYNEQKEINIHNLSPIQIKLHQIYVLFCICLTFSWILFKYILSIRYINPNLKTKILLLIPNWYLMLYFMPALLLYSYFIIFNNNMDGKSFIIWRDQEPTEFLLSLGLLFHIVSMKIKFKKISA